MSGDARIALASASPRRRDLLTRLGVPFEVVPADVDESLVSGETPERMVERLAREKALAIPGRYVLAADTTVVATCHQRLSLSLKVAPWPAPRTKPPSL